MGLFAAWIAEVAIVTWRDLSGKDPSHTVKGFPLPADYLATIVIFGGWAWSLRTTWGPTAPPHWQAGPLS